MIDSIAAELSEVAFLIARSMVSFGIFSALAFFMAVASPGDAVFPPDLFASTAIKRTSLPNILLFCASEAPFWRLIFDHLLCPDIYTQKIAKQESKCNKVLIIGRILRNRLMLID